MKKASYTLSASTSCAPHPDCMQVVSAIAASDVKRTYQGYIYSIESRRIYHAINDNTTDALLHMSVNVLRQ